MLDIRKAYKHALRTALGDLVMAGPAPEASVPIAELGTIGIGLADPPKLGGRDAMRKAEVA